jgi:hypothetical protein
MLVQKTAKLKPQILKFADQIKQTMVTAREAYSDVPEKHKGKNQR